MRRTLMKRLLLEELERRSMLAANPFVPATTIANQSTGLTSNSVEDVYYSEEGTEGGGAAGIGMFDNGIGAIDFDDAEAFPTDPATTNPSIPNSPAATTGVGQMVITTGANTLGISSFASPTTGSLRGATGGKLKDDPDQAPAEEQEARIKLSPHEDTSNDPAVVRRLKPASAFSKDAQSAKRPTLEVRTGAETFESLRP
jgi:hypothetical protein